MLKRRLSLNSSKSLLLLGSSARKLRRSGATIARDTAVEVLPWQEYLARLEAL